MRVLIVHDEPVPLGGAESHVGTLARSLEQTGHTVEVCYEEVPQTIARFEPDIIHLQTIIVKVGIGALEYCQEIGIPHLISLHDYWPICRSRMMLKEKYRTPCARCDDTCEYPPAPNLRRLVGSSPSISFNRRSQRIFQEHGFRYNTLVPHGIDTAYFAPAERHDGPTVTYMAAWARMPWKGLTEFSRAAMMVPLDTPGAVVKALGMCGNPVPRERVRKHLQETDIFVFPSLYEETFGLSLAEAMSCGCACVAFDVAGANDLLSGIGILVATGDVAGLTSALTHLLNHPEQCEQLGAASRERMVRYFDMAAMAADYTRLYGGLVDNWRNWREWLPSYKCREIPFGH